MQFWAEADTTAEKTLLWFIFILIREYIVRLKSVSHSELIEGIPLKFHLLFSACELTKKLILERFSKVKSPHWLSSPQKNLFKPQLHDLKSFVIPWLYQSYFDSGTIFKAWLKLRLDLWVNQKNPTPITTLTPESAISILDFETILKIWLRFDFNSWVLVHFVIRWASDSYRDSGEILNI